MDNKQLLQEMKELKMDIEYENKASMFKIVKEA